MSIRQRLLANLEITLALFLICFGFMTWGAFRYDILQNGVEVVNRQVQGWLSLNFQVSQYLKGGLEAILSGKKLKEEEISTTTDKIIHTFIGLEKTARMKQRYLTADEQAQQTHQLIDIRNQFGLINEELEKSIVLLNQDKTADAYKLISSQITDSKLDDKFIKLIEDALKKEEEHAFRIGGDLKSLKKRLISFFIALITASLSLGAFLMFRVNRSVQQSIQSAQTEILRGTQSLGSGNLNTQIHFETKDELSVVAVAFNKMAQDLKNRSEVIERIYHNVKSAFLLVDRRLNIEEGFTDSCKVIFDSKINPGIPFTKLFSLSPRDEGHFLVMLEQVFEDILPENASIEQLPLQHEIGSRTLRLEPSVVRDEKGMVQHILFTIHDITKLKQAERENINNTILMKILRQKEVFCRCLLDARLLLQSCAAAVRNKREKEVRAKLHTIKGNVGIFELSDIASVIHAIEDKPNIDIEDIFKIESAFRSFLVKNESILRIAYEVEAAEIYSVSRQQVEVFSKAIQKIDNPNELRNQLMQWIKILKHKPLEEVLSPIVSLSQNLSKRLQKPITTEIIAPETLVDAERLAPILQILPHLVRNAIDHGIEGPENRGRKPKMGKIIFSVTLVDSDWVVCIQDDGRGVDLERVAEKALESGAIDSRQLANMSTQEKVELIFREKVTTAKKVSEISGRGIGMSAVLDVVQKIGGNITIFTTLSSGTKIEIRIPADKDEQNIHSNGSNQAAA